MLAALAYFAWIGYLTAPLPLLLMNLRAFKRAPELAYHAWNATSWSLFVAGLRVLLLLAGIWAGACKGPQAQSLCSALSMANIVVVLAFATLTSIVWGVEALLGRMVRIPLLSRWARRQVDAMRKVCT